MQKSTLILIGFAVFLSTSLLYPVKANAQLQVPSTNSSSQMTGTGNTVSVSSTITLQVTNATLKTNQGMLKSAIFDFLNSGPNVLKISDGTKIIVKTKIINQIANVTQSVEGIEATNAIIGVEIGKALTEIVSSPNKGGIVSVGTSSTCKLAVANSISCDGAVTIK